MGTTLLAIDTAGPRLQLALLRQDGRIDAIVEEMPQGQAERLFPAVGELLARNDLRHSDLGRIAVTAGPGSFTGVRIGLSAARGLALALGVPVIGLGSLQAVSLSGPAGSPLAVILDARRGQAYLQRFSAPGMPAGEPMLADMDEARRLVPSSAVVLTGPFPDIAALARFAVDCDPAVYRPVPFYGRSADAKPQDRFRVARAEAS